MILVDTDVWIDFFHGRDPGAAAVHALLGSGDAALGSVTLFELLAGVGSGSRRASQVVALAAALPVLPFGEAEAVIAGGMFTALRSGGKTIGNEDIFLGAMAAQAGVPVLTRNVAHFSRMSGVEVLTPTDVTG